jgi:5'-methylthioadenosine phosphorylase
MAKNIIRHAVAEISSEKSCACGTTLEYAIITDRAAVPAETYRKLAPILSRTLAGRCPEFDAAIK